jgi:tRNA pseudouridine38-40 synthase
MQLWKLILAYDGTGFHGWQVQPQLRTVQGTLAEAIRNVTGEIVLPQGSGRTDAGVHALGQVASFALAAAIPPANLLRALNRALPPSIRVLSAAHAPDLGTDTPFHARHTALRKTYEYRIFPRICAAGNSQPDRICPPTLAPYVWDCPWHVDLALADHAAAAILGEHDFSSFAASEPDVAQREGEAAAPSTIRQIFASGWHREPQRPGQPDLLVYRVTGSGFLHHMVRILVGTFVAVASGRIAPDAVPQILAARNRAAAGPTAPARGLFLVNVEYPESATLAATQSEPVEVHA